MKLRLFALLALLMLLPGEAGAYRAVASCPSAVAIWTAGATSVDPVVDLNGNVCTTGGDAAQLPTGATALTASATGTTLATPVEFAATASVTNYVCGFSIRANATGAATGNATLAGTVVGTMNFTQWTAPLASGIGTIEQTFYPCIPASAVNTALTLTSAAPGAGGTVSVTMWGYRK